MDARRKIDEYLRPVLTEVGRRPVHNLLDEFAHELAERIRNSEELRDRTDDHMGDCNAAADLIDPKEK
jgi:uncharacterized membrane protein